MPSQPGTTTAATPSAMPSRIPDPGPRLLLAAPPEHVADGPLVVTAGFTEPGTQRPNWGCPAREMGHRDWQLWWSLRPARDPSVTAGAPTGHVPAAGPVPNASRSGPESGPFAGPPAGVGREALVALLPPAALERGWYTVSVTARATGAWGPAVQTRTALVRVWRAPLCAAGGVEVRVGARQSAGTAAVVAGRTALFLSLRTECRLPPGYTFRWQYETPSGHTHPLGHSASPAGPVVTAVAPWPLPPVTTATLVFGVRVQGPSGTAHGPALGRAAVAVRVPEGSRAAECASASVWQSVARHLHCLGGAAAVTRGYPWAHVVPELETCARRPPVQRLQVLSALREGFARNIFGGADTDFVGRLQAMVARAGDCVRPSQELRQGLVALVSEAMAGPLLRDVVRRMGDIAAELEVLESALRGAWDNCSFPATAAFATPLLRLSLIRLPKTDMPPLQIGPVTVGFPPSLQSTSLSLAHGAAVDVTLIWVRGTAPAVTDAVTVTLTEPASSAELPVHDLPDPIVIDFGLPRHALRQPPSEWYECASHVHGSWDPAGVWLTAGPDGLRCHTTHLSTFAVLPVVRVTSVTGCALDVPPTTLFCLGDSRESWITVTGGNFGDSGAVLSISSEAVDTPNAAHWECDSVQHRPGDADSVLVCAGLRPRPSSSHPPAHPQWGYVTVTTASGLSDTFVHPILFSGRPRVTHIVPVPAAALCACRGNGTAARCHCPRGSAPFGIRGEGLLGYGPSAVTVGSLACPEVRVHNASYVTCWGLRGRGEHLPVRVAAQGQWSERQTGVTVSYYDPCAARGPGHWEGDACTRCWSGYYGSGCTAACPGTLAATVCTGHGHCDDGVQGTGRCFCHADAGRGHWDGADCSRCHEGWAGPGCTEQCPRSDPHGTGSLWVCGGRGVCGPTSTCSCRWPFTGPACGLVCPVRGGRVCAGHGDCVPGNASEVGRCVCRQGPGSGHWDGPDCQECVSGYTGPDCTAQCPDACSGHGHCLWLAGPVCVCRWGWAGEDCALQCPQALGMVCAGHGTCVARNGTAAACACVASDTAGHWHGPACETCAPGWRGAACALRCPTDPGTGRVCGRAGLCTSNGTCQCLNGTCGGACERDREECAGVAPCPPGRWGRACVGRCACAPAGTCDDGPFGSGACRCRDGWTGPRCDVRCGPCGGHGACDPSTGRCRCNAGWGSLGDGAPCSARCPGHGSCSGHGHCTAAAACVCEVGYGGAGCEVVCPRSRHGDVCHGHGACSPATGACICAAGPLSGFWADPQCTSCATGYAGPTCSDRCVFGATVGRQCVCRAGYTGPECAHACPAPGLRPCGARGLCVAAANGSAAVCLCLRGYAGPACQTECPGGAASPCSGHGLCDPATGVCRCQDNAAGHWGGIACHECRPPFFGAACDRRCPADEHGRSCGARGLCTDAGDCVCHADAMNGMWRGAACTDCRPGFYGPSCTHECPGGAANVCQGHGTCSAGMQGSGDCACDASADAGFFAGRACKTCLPGYYGPACLSPCPSGPETPCSGHGVCSDGLYGTGRCACDGDPVAGYWAGADCSACASGFGGPACTTACPGSGPAPCTGHGRCTPEGACRCDAGWAGLDCRWQCPSADAAVCSGHGVCEAGPAGAVCRCDWSSSAGLWMR